MWRQGVVAGCGGRVWRQGRAFAAVHRASASQLQHPSPISEPRASTLTRQVPQLVLKCRHKGPLYLSALSSDEVIAFSSMMKRLNAIAELAWQLGVRLMVDAEHTYFQPCIDHAVLRLQRKFNGDYPAVFGTYQVRLADSFRTC